LLSNIAQSQAFSVPIQSERTKARVLDLERQRKNGLSTGEEPGPSFIGCHGGITSGRPSPSGPGNIGSGQACSIPGTGVQNSVGHAPLILRLVYLSEDCSLHQVIAAIGSVGVGVWETRLRSRP